MKTSLQNGIYNKIKSRIIYGELGLEESCLNLNGKKIKFEPDASSGGFQAAADVGKLPLEEIEEIYNTMGLLEEMRGTGARKIDHSGLKSTLIFLTNQRD